MSNENGQIEKQIGELVKRLEKTLKEQTAIAQELKALKRKLGAKRRSEQANPLEIIRPSTLISPVANKFGHTWFRDTSGDIYEGDLFPQELDVVRIVNPGKDQAELGQIVGFCNDGSIKIDTHQGKPVIRALKNIRHLSREDEASSYY